MVVVIMGVSGSGKSTVGRKLAARMGWEFRDGDDFHPAANVAKMRLGQPLTDEDRAPWLGSIAEFMRSTQEAGRPAVVACSALKELHRSWLLKGEPWVRFFHLAGSKELIAERMKRRAGHFMPVTLLDSQFATLEAPADVSRLDIALTPEVLVEQIVEALQIYPACPKTPSEK
jgi:gluconokinase